MSEEDKEFSTPYRANERKEVEETGIKQLEETESRLEEGAEEDKKEPSLEEQLDTLE
jgi:hypothetical protein